MNEQPKKERAVKCEGRFGSIRDYLYDQVMPVVMEGRCLVTTQDLKDIWELAEDELRARESRRDPYFYSSKDSLRLSPPESYLSLVPLLEAPSHMPDSESVTRYARAVGCGDELAKKLFLMRIGTNDFLTNVLSRETKDIYLPSGGDLRGYRIAAHGGIGTISSGGTSGGGIRSDSPFLLEVYRDSQEKNRRGESNLVGVIGFWPQNDSMLVSQMQSCRNAHYPSQEKFGVASLHIAETIAKWIGFEKIQAYSAHNHPLFLEHPDSRAQLMGEFRCMWDTSAHKLGFEGCNQKNFSKDLANNYKK